MNLRKCPLCNNEPVEKDCGYTTFNPRWVECQCGLKSEGTPNDWNVMVSALESSRTPSKAKRKLSDALARILTEDQLWNLLKGYEPNGQRKIRSF